ncbi:hypothetical protein [Rhizobium laguerreae]|uniref:hypothetical protein n=1 Tax=Rhizobium laguerreae TaxID=1076926 RepID=UPI0014419648|nr:hypothetical protein [Rhizobium laguerreae]NKM36340.1 hypothetical protein [Rhizobium laguerreae]
MFYICSFLDFESTGVFWVDFFKPFIHSRGALHSMKESNAVRSIGLQACDILWMRNLAAESVDEVRNPAMTIDPNDEAEQILPDPTFWVWDDRLRPEEKEIIDEANEALLRLSDTRAIEINASGPFLRSKLAWKIAVYAHGLQHRVVGLSDAVALCWNSRSTLGAMLNARALLETIAVVAHLERTIQRLLRIEDIGALNDFIDNGTFAKRDREVLSKSPDIEARNILTSIAVLEKTIPGTRAHYDRLSERCHPNYMGHVALFSELNREDGSVSFRKERHPDTNAQAVLGAYLFLPLVEDKLISVTDHNTLVSDLQHRLNPVVNEQP